MSLKAKIEAVVYAAEEPVTLAQLAALFAEEALEWNREHQAPAEPPSDNAAPAAEQVTLSASLDPATDPAVSAPAVSAEDTPVAEAIPEAEAAAEPPAASEPSSEPPSEAAASPEADAKRLARQRDREVRETLRLLLDELIEEYDRSDRGIEIREIAGGYRVGTKPEYHDSVRAFVKSLKPPMKLSLQALETLAVIAYKQPVTAPEVSEIRGVDSAGVLGSLISRKLITTAGRKQVIGRPILYKTTKEFLLRFGLKDVNELPSIEEFEKMAGELADSELAEEPETPVTEELPFAEAATSEASAAEGEKQAVEAVEVQPHEGEFQTEAPAEPVDESASEAAPSPEEASHAAEQNPIDANPDDEPQAPEADAQADNQVDSQADNRANAQASADPKPEPAPPVTVPAKEED
ncbi:MAG TPA: SMC-Scp complex subunit ScpB [Acidisarcina sp.]|nr:SMC-Scp complex subunit ScpB [Acidisarcina sp.]